MTVGLALSQLPVAEGDDVYDEKLFPSERRDVFGQQIDCKAPCGCTALR